MANRTPYSGPFFGENYLDIPTQRLLVLGLLTASQAIKLGEFTTSWVDIDGPSLPQLFIKWTFIDAILVWLVPYLRIPRLQFDQRARVAQITLLTLFNYALFGNYIIVLGRFLPSPVRAIIGLFEYDELAISQRRVKIQDVIDYGAHLLGQHTVRLSLIGAAKFNPDGLPFCLTNPSIGVLIPIILNNTKTASLVQYSIAPLGDKGPRDYINVTSRELNKMQSAAAAYFAEQDRLLSSIEADYDDEDEDYATRARTAQSQLKMIPASSRAAYLAGKKLEKTQSLIYLRLTRPGFVRLERILDGSHADVRIRRYSGQLDTTVVECPSAVLNSEDLADLQCAGTAKEIHINVRGTAPLTLQWHRVIDGKKAQFTVEGIEGGSETRGLPVAQEVEVPLDLRLNTPGLHTYALDTVSDGVGNVVDLLSTASHEFDIKKSVSVLGRSSVSFRGCGTGPEKTVDLLQGKEGTLIVALNNLDPADGPWTVTIAFEPTDSGGRKEWMKGFVSLPDKKTLDVPVTESGEYTIVNLRGQTCSGEILSPETCRVVEQPKPTAEITFQSIQECSSDTGVSAKALLHGVPPFVLVYTEKHDKNPPKTHVKTFNTARGEIVLKPERSGSYTYTFTHMSDRNYHKVPIAGTPSTTRHVHPLASAAFVRTGIKSGDVRGLMSNCEGESIDMELDLSGTPPFTVELQLVGSKGSETKSYESINKTREAIAVPILSELREAGGTMEVDLVSVTDNNGCQRALDVAGISVFVKRVKPTVKFYSADNIREALILETETAHLPLRFTGDGPWDITYQVTDPTEADTGRKWSTRSVRIKSANANLDVKQPGLYALTDVKDTHCPGRVIEEQATYLVSAIPRPTAVFGQDTGELNLEGTIVRRPVCEGVEDFVDVKLSGRPPFQVTYAYLSRSSEGRSKDRITFNSIQTASRLQLRTAEAGHHEYHISRVGDSAYHLASSPELSRLSGLVLVQDVLVRSSAYFRSSGTGSFCLNHKLVPEAAHGDEAILVLHGQPPFKVQLAIKNLAISSMMTETVEVSLHEWELELPDYIFKTVGPHIITIESFEDASMCQPSPVESGSQSFRVDVAETAAIVPFERREDFCVGDVLHFQLEGKAPWKIHYRFNGKNISATSKVPKFSRVAEKPGIFEIVSIAHQQASCQSEVSDIRINIRQLPSARVSHGKNIVEDVREGDQAEIVFTLIGEPPFTFTYQRASLETHKGSHKILETHTVSGVMTHEYSIFSALEGTWTVTFISDKYCRYPPATTSSRFESP